MLYLLLGMLIGVLILLKIGKKDPQIIESNKKTDSEPSSDVSEENILEKAQDLLPRNVGFSSEEIKKRQEKILGNLNESERKLFMDYIAENSTNMKKIKTNPNEKNDFAILYDNLLNLSIIFSIGSLVYYFANS
jgi:hypothetical protein